ncbi:MAG: FAD-dependent oxidoreductase, partial [Chloroflexi bacterium]|nr:FAD-dependent oxidoreductase [Chloroflexota bacterium]
MSDEIYYDVVVVGAGNAALCAALAAREQGADVAVLEKAPPSAQGGNCPYTGAGFRFTHNGLDDVRHLVPGLTDADLKHTSMAPYSAKEFREHLTTVTFGDTSEELMEALIRESRPTVEWMHKKGVAWELPVAGSIARAASTIPNQVGLA